MFAGPTLARARRIAPGLTLPGARVLPPAARGDVEALVRRSAPATIALVDGVFHDRLAVGHVELREAVAAGWTVWGLSSMGAIRAREMSHLGVRGFGAVHAHVEARDRDVRDDEVALLHAPAPTYAELSEPLIHLRVALASFAARGALAPSDAGAIAAELAELYFGDRTLGLFAELVRRRAPDLDPLDGFDAHRIKCHDLIRFAAHVAPPPGADPAGGAEAAC